jgi:hypothetical protein
MKYILLSQNKKALVDDADFDWLSQWKWSYSGRYAHRMEKDKKIYMHRLIMGFPKWGFVVDHIDRNELNNCRTNLRVVTQSINTINGKFRINNTSGHKGLIWCKADGRWKAQVWVNGKSINRYSKHKEVAVQKLMALRKTYYGELA